MTGRAGKVRTGGKMVDSREETLIIGPHRMGDRRADGKRGFPWQGAGIRGRILPVCNVQRFSAW